MRKNIVKGFDSMLARVIDIRNEDKSKTIKTSYNEMLSELTTNNLHHYTITFDQVKKCIRENTNASKCVPTVFLKDWLTSISAYDFFIEEDNQSHKSHYIIKNKDNYLPSYGLRVVSRLEIGEKNVYDISVKDTHSFLANGLVVHNCWFESGCVPFAQAHYPFENKGLIDSADALSDFVVEGLDQTRGWFYTLLVIATAMTDGTKVPFKNVICTGMVLDEFGRKISKNLGNDIDTKAYISKYGADIIRLYLIGSPLIQAEPLKFTPLNVDLLKKNQIRYVNGVKFFLEHASNFQKNNHTFALLGRDMKFSEVTDVFDRWILSRLSELVRAIDDDMENYRLNKVVEKQLDFIEDIVNWYIKFNRSRIKGLYGDVEWSKSLSVLHFVLHTYSLLCAPTTPFLSEHIYQNIYVPVVKDAPESIHFMSYPSFSSMIDTELDKVFRYLKKICEGMRALRDKSDKHLSVKMPIKSCVIYHDDQDLLNLLSKNMDMVQEEVNCISMKYKTLKDNIAYSIEPNFKIIGKKFGKLTGKVSSTMRSLSSDTISSMGANFEMVVDGDTLIITPECYTLHKNPGSSESELATSLVDDVMIGVDFTLDEEVKLDYVSKCMHSSIQNTRKLMGLRPWDKINVVLCQELMEHVGDLPARLGSSLTNSDVTWSNTDEQEFKVITEIKMNNDVFNGSYTVTKQV